MSGPSKRKKTRQKANTKMIWGRLRDVKGSKRMLLNNERDRIVEDERG